MDPKFIKTKDGQKWPLPDVLREERTLTAAIVTPELATYFLEGAGNGFCNRHINGERVNQYAKDMLDGKWLLNGSTIAFTCAGVLVDGYTRLSASYIKDATFMTDIRCGIDPEAVATIDTGRPRSLQNVLAMKNETTSTALAQGASWLYRYKEDLIYEGGKVRRSHTDMIDFITRHPQLRDAVEFTKDVRNKKIAPVGILVSTYYICDQHNAAQAKEFFRLLADGVGYTATSPVRHLRDMLMQREQKRLKPAEQFQYVLHAFGKFMSGEQVRLLRLPPSGLATKLKKGTKKKR